MKVIWTNGCFDILHRGHIELFKYAKSLGDWLVVGIDTDERVKASKGPSRPFNTIEDRIAILESIKYIDEIYVFDTNSELDTQVLLSGAEIMVVGSDYRNKKVIGRRHAQKVKFFDRIKGYSTTNILVGLQ
jgi:rfaE bifunctional protein nucleotidyltransferase chain/domain|tara:strand:- start:640 stop:1032 length:393 start_codon:yes stop_codon:yes gene_type:complete